MLQLAQKHTQLKSDTRKLRYPDQLKQKIIQISENPEMQSTKKAKTKINKKALQHTLFVYLLTNRTLKKKLKHQFLYVSFNVFIDTFCLIFL